MYPIEWPTLFDMEEYAELVTFYKCVIAFEGGSFLVLECLSSPLQPQWKSDNAIIFTGYRRSIMHATAAELFL